MIGESFDRITFLINHKRYEDAVKELKQAIAEDANNAYLFILLADCYNELNKLDLALNAGKHAVHLAPDLDDAHRTIARTYNLLDKEKTGLHHAREAVSINPDEAANHALLGATYLQMSQWEKALRAVDDGLAQEPDHMGCLNIRTIALTKLGRKREVDDTIQAALQENPEDAMTHANWGWSLLHQGKADEAVGHFKEALKQNPELEWARLGIVEAIKGKNIIYGLILRFYLWLGKFPPKVQIILIVGLFLLEKIIRGTVSSIPAIAPLADYILITYVTFVFMAWMSSSFFNLLLRLHPEGKLALSTKQRAGSTWFGLGLIATIAIAAMMYIKFGTEQGMWGLIIPLFLLFPITVAIKARPGKTKMIMTGYAILSTLFLLAGLTTNMINLINVSLIMSILSTWLGNFVPRDREMI